MKRFWDLLLSFIALLLLSPVFLITALLIVIDSKGPIFFCPLRVGRYNRDFKLYKFRTMQVGNSSVKSNLTLGDSDPRITRIGKFLRKTKIDELPQFFNVLKGDISLVGPRPIMREFVEMYYEAYKPILAIRPGITSNASIFFRNEGKVLSQKADPEEYHRVVIMPKKIELNLCYVYHRTLWSDFRILLLTLYCTLTDKNYRSTWLLKEPLIDDEGDFFK